MPFFLSYANCQDYLTSKTYLKHSVQASPLFFQAKTGGLDYAINNQTSSNDIDGNIEKPNFDWRVGARITTSYTFDYEDLDIELEGSFILSNPRDKVKRDVVDQFQFGEEMNGTGIIPNFLNPKFFMEENVRFSLGKADLHLSFYNISLSLKKSFYISKRFSSFLLFGLKNTYIFQKCKLRYLNGKTFPIAPGELLTPIYNKVYLENNTYAIGPRVGSNMSWYFYKNSTIFFDIFGSLQQTFFYTKRKDKSSFIRGKTYFEESLIKDDFSSFKPSVEARAGISWEKELESIPLFIILKFAYETEYFFKVSQFINLSNQVSDSYTKKGENFQLHGFSITAAFFF